MTGRLQVNMNFLERISGTQGPAVGNLPIRRDLEAMRFSETEVRIHKGQDKVWRRWSWLEEGSTRFYGFLIALAVVISRDIHRKPLRHCHSVACFVRDGCFVEDFWIAEEPESHRSSIYVCGPAKVRNNGGIRSCGSAVRIGNCRPESSLCAGSPCHSHARQYVQARVMVMFNLRAYGQEQPVGNKGDVVLNEGTEERCF